MSARTPLPIPAALRAFDTPSPELNHRYTCQACPGTELFIGLDDAGCLGDCECDDDPCTCSLVGTLRQTFYPNAPGVEPTYGDPEGGRLGRAIGAYTRILCGSCGALVWFDVSSGPAIAEWLSNDGPVSRELFDYLALLDPAALQTVLHSWRIPTEWTIPRDALAGMSTHPDAAVRARALGFLSRVEDDAPSHAADHATEHATEHATGAMPRGRSTRSRRR